MNESSAFAKRLSEFNSGYCREVPSLLQTHDFVDNLIHTLFPIKRGCLVDPEEIAIEMDRCAIKLKELLYSIRNSLKQSPERLVEDFFAPFTGSF